MTMLENLAVPDFSVPSTAGSDVSLAAAKGRHVGIYVYPKDDTPGGTTEGAAVRDHYREVQAAGGEVGGVWRETLASHAKFKAKMAFPFELLADTDEAVCTMFGVMKMKNMYGKQVRGIERSTFVIDRSGVLRREWRGVKVPDHAREVLDFVKSL